VKVHEIVGFELLAAMTVKSVVFIGVMTYYPIIIPGLFGVTY
jgi:hypothetical protein